MSQLRGKWVLITGATAGIGEACARRFAAEEARVVLWARRAERLDRLRAELESAGATVRVATVDVRDAGAVESAAGALEADGVEVDILINNAGLALGFAPVQEGRTGDWDVMIDTNLKGLLWVTRAILPGMVRRDRGHVVNLGSTAGHWPYPSGNVYNATKFGVWGFTQAMSMDLLGSAVRVTSIDPGFVETEFSVVRFHGDIERAGKVYEGFQPLRADDIADAIVYVTAAPSHVNVLDMVILPTAQRSAMLVHRAPD